MRRNNQLGHFPYLLLSLFLVQCQAAADKRPDDPAEDAAKIRHLSFVGKIRDQPVQEMLYEAVPFDSLPSPLISGQVAAALEHQYAVLNYSRTKTHRLSPELTVWQIDLIKTVHTLLQRRHSYLLGLNDQLVLYRLQGEDQRANVRFTGYYSPVVEVSETQTPEYRYPMYRRPRDWDGPLPTRREIEQDGALDTLDLVIGWANNKFDVYLMQIQGSGHVKYPNGKISFFAYDGTNQHAYRSMEKYLRSWDGPQPKYYSLDGIHQFFHQYPDLTDTVLFQNPSYTFFKPSMGQPRGAGSVPLTPEISIAVDRRFIPLGSCLLAAVPIYDHEKRRVTHHEYRLLLAQDVGGSIKGPGHVDLYMGAGEEAGRRANMLHHYGQLYLILPKK